MRGWLNDTRSYVPPVQINEVMRAAGLAVVVEAGPNSKFSKGEILSGSFGWTEYVIMKDKAVQRIQPLKGAEPLDYLHAMGFPGMTAYFGLYDVGKLKKGETLVVSGAAGAVGSLVCQFGKQSGATVIAIAGSSEKCAWLKKSIGVDHALNYKDSNFYANWKELGYFDVFFDNVGGDMLDFALRRMNKGARIALCGAISQYNAAKPNGLRAYQSLIAQRAKLEGFIVFDYVKEFPAAQKHVADMLASGKLQRKFHVVEGLSNAPSALPMLFTGGNTGKLVIKVAQDEDATSKL